MVVEVCEKGECKVCMHSELVFGLPVSQKIGPKSDFLATFQPYNSVTSVSLGLKNFLARFFMGLNNPTSFQPKTRHQSTSQKFTHVHCIVGQNLSKPENHSNGSKQAENLWLGVFKGALNRGTICISRRSTQRAR